MTGNISNIIVYISLFSSLFFEIFLLITYLEKKEVLKKESLTKEPKRFPSVTIIVPCFNEEKTISETLTSLLSLNYPENKLDIFVVDDGSTDGTLDAVSKFNAHKNLKVFSKENGGKYTALNYALNHIESEMVGCLDADSFVDKEALNKIVSYFEDEEVMAVTPAIRVHNPKNAIELMQRVEYAWGIFLRKMLSYLGAIYVTPGPFSIFRKSVFDQLGGYKHAHHTEDFEMALRMQTNRMKIVNAHDAFVYTVTPRNVKTLYKQRLRWTYGFLNNLIDYKHLLFDRSRGHIGMYILPMAVISIFTALYFTGFLILNLVTKIYEEYQKINTVGWSFSPPKLDLFYLDISSILLITISIIALTVVIIAISKQIAEGRFRAGKDFFYFLFLYGLVAPLWLSRAVFNTVFSKEITWK